MLEPRVQVDLENGVLYRTPQGKIKTTMRQPPILIPPRLHAYLHRWVAKGIAITPNSRRPLPPIFQNLIFGTHKRGCITGWLPTWSIFC